MIRIFSCLMAFVYVFSGHQSSAGIASLRTLWPQGKDIRGCFFGGTQAARAAIAEIANEWTSELSVHFDFGKAGALNYCDSEVQSYDIRVGFRGKGFWAETGMEARRKRQDHPTMNLPDQEFKVNPDARAEILHQFGHALGILHQEQDASAKCAAYVDRAYVESQSQTVKDIAELISEVKVAPNNGEYVTTPFDTKSVMRAIKDTKFYQKDSPCSGPPATQLSNGDLRLARMLYPNKPPDVSSAEPRQLAVRFEGRLAAEHFGYVVSALYDVREIKLKKHISLENENIAAVIYKEKLTPRGITSDSFEQFLCRINSHVCVWQKGVSTWTNAKADKNYTELENLCGSKNLPKFVLCIPNIRLEPYIFISQISYSEKSKSTLSQLVVRKYKGCDAWDKGCQTLVAKINPQLDLLEEARVESLALPATFSGPLNVPAKGYRLVVEYQNDAERDRIERTVSDVISERARTLQVSRDDIAISMTFALGDPTPQAASAVYLEPDQSYTDPLKKMAYPFGDTDNKPELSDLIKVHAAIWDTRVDTAHCELQNIVSSTLRADSPGGPSVPDKAEKCGASRPPGYELSSRFDHATAVAGILSAKVNGVGIAGVFPDMKLWAWEVLDSNQIGADDPRVIMSKQFPDLNPVVVNISQSYQVLTPGKQTQLERILFGNNNPGRHTNINPGVHNTQLLVAAAGAMDDENGQKTGQEVHSNSSACTLYPACLSNGPGTPPRALISVVGLSGAGDGILSDRKGRALSNYGDAFDVAAIGQTTTTFHGDWIGSFSGSSAAAPYVTGLGALLFAKTKLRGFLPRPMEVKNRILFTSDIIPTFKNASRYGRINFSKALNFENDMIRLVPSVSCDEDPCWKAVHVKREMTPTIRIVSGTSEGGVRYSGPVEIDFKMLKSLKKTENDTFTVLFVDASGDALTKIVNAKIIFDPRPIIAGNGPAAYAFDLPNLLEYVSCSWYEPCGYN
jgi:hypothetical protein